MASIDPNFRKVTAALRKHGQDNAKALINEGPFRGETLAVPANSGPDANDSESIKRYFDRTGLGQQYVATIEKPADANGINVAIAAKLQSDFLAACERDWRIQRQMNRVRALCLAASRREAHGSDTGPIAKGIVQMPQNYLKLGQTDNQE